MKKLILSAFSATLLLASCSSSKKTAPDFSKNMDQYIITDSLSYAWGIVQAKEMQMQKVSSLNQTDYMRAFKRTIDNQEEGFPEDLAYGMVETSIKEKANQQNEMSKEKGEAFLAENGKREGVITLESGLQYEVIQAGDGPIPTASQKVTTHYTGSLIDGTIFDSSVQRGEPITFPVGGVIMGWQEALQLMPKGSKWKLFIPQDLAYGSRGAGNVIPPFSALIFEIELLDIQP